MTEAKQQRLWDALKRIASYSSPEYICRHSGSEWGVFDGNEALEMAYENVISEAREAIRGTRRPGVKAGS